jgi:hypothetical protein
MTEASIASDATTADRSTSHNPMLLGEGWFGSRSCRSLVVRTAMSQVTVEHTNWAVGIGAKGLIVRLTAASVIIAEPHTPGDARSEAYAQRKHTSARCRFVVPQALPASASAYRMPRRLSTELPVRGDARHDGEVLRLIPPPLATCTNCDAAS